MNGEIENVISHVLADELHCDSDLVCDDAILGSAGLGLESLDLLHLIYTLSDEFHVQLIDDLEPYQTMTVSGLAADVAARMADE